MAAERFFTKLANDVLEASEKISVRMEEGLAVMMTGNLPESSTGGGGGGQGEGAGPSSSSRGEPEFDFAAGSGDQEGFTIADDGADDDMVSPLDGIAGSVLSDIMKHQVGPQNPWEHFQAFRHAIRWKEPFILGLVTSQILMFLICLWVSRKDRGLAPRITVMILIAIIVRGSERINALGNVYWEDFATQNYFDQRGVFMSIMVCAPLLVNSLIMMLMFVREAGQLLILVKTTELKQKRKQMKEQQKQQQSTDAAASTPSADGTKSRRAKKDQ